MFYLKTKENCFLRQKYIPKHWFWTRHKVLSMQIIPVPMNMMVREAHISMIYIWLVFILTQGHYFFIAFRERGREKEKHRCKREASTGCLPYALVPGNEPTTFWLWDHTPTTWAILARVIWLFNIIVLEKISEHSHPSHPRVTVLSANLRKSC